MTRLTYLTPTLFATLCLGLAACNKSNSKPNTPPADSTTTTTTTTTATMNINCTLPSTGTQTELVISEPGGKTLLDTVTGNAGPMIATLKTNDTLLDVTLVIQAAPARFFASTYKSINPSRLTSLNVNSYVPAFNVGPSTTSFNIVYYNIPPAFTSYSFSDILFTYYFTGGTSSQGGADPNNHTIQYTYKSYAGNYTYLLLPQLGLCMLHMQEQALDSVDCTHMDTAIALTFDRPFPFTTMTGASSLYAIPDTNDLSKIISYTNQLGSIGQGLDFEYAPFPAEKYEMNYYATDNNNDILNYYAYTNTLPKTLPLFQSSDYFISSSQPDDYTVTFPGTRPSYYNLAYGDSILSYTVWASPDTATLHPITLLTNQKCKLLQNVKLTDLPRPSLTMINFNGFDYTG